MEKFVIVASSFRIAKQTLDRLAVSIGGLTRESFADNLRYYNGTISISAIPIGDGSVLHNLDTTCLVVDPTRIPKDLLKS